jgi:two-component system response regulator CpxR
MPVISLFSGCYCNEKQVVQEIGSRTGYRLISDKEVACGNQPALQYP